MRLWTRQKFALKARTDFLVSCADAIGAARSVVLQSRSLVITKYNLYHCTMSTMLNTRHYASQICPSETCHCGPIIDQLSFSTPQCQEAIPFADKAVSPMLVPPGSPIVATSAFFCTGNELSATEASGCPTNAGASKPVILHMPFLP